MKITSILLFAVMLSITAEIHSQEKNLSLKIEKGSLKEVFRSLKQKTSYTFVYSESHIEGIEVEGFSTEESSIVDILNTCLENTDLNFFLDDNIVVIKKKPISNAHKEVIQQPEKKITITGTVKDEKGEPLPFAAVCFKGTTTGCTSAVDGSYTLDAPDEEGLVLEVSSLGFKTQTIAVDGRTVINIVLVSDIENLDEVVVTGLQTVKQGRATGSFQIINEEDLDAIFSDNVAQKLQGVAPGVYINSDNEIFIRGINTIEGETSPLIVIDGIPTQMSLSDINPNDIKQITVLKDAASASIWGVRSSNGVIVITTKRGQFDGKTQVTYNGTVSLEEKRNLDNMHYLNSADYVDLEWAFNELFFVDDYRSALSPVSYIYQDHINDSEDDYRANLTALKKVNNWKQIEDNFYQNRLIQQHNIAINSGSKNIKNYLSLNYFDTKGELIGDEADKFNILNNLDIRLNDKLDLNLNLKFSYEKEKQNGENPLMRPYEAILDQDGEYVLYSNVVHKEYYDDYQELGLLDWTYNPLRQRKVNDNEMVSKTLGINAALNYKIIDGLKFSTNFSYELIDNQLDRYSSKHHYTTRNFFNTHTQVTVDQAGQPVALDDKNGWIFGKTGGLLKRNVTNARSYIFRNKLNYLKSFGDFRINALIGIEYNAYDSELIYNNFIGYNEDTNALTYVDYNTISKGGFSIYDGFPISPLVLNETYPSVTNELDRYISYFSTANINYKEKYNFFVSARLDQTNLLVKAKKYRDNPTWSVGTKWNIDKEEFFNSTSFDYLSAKLSYGVSGLIAKNVSPELTGEIGRLWMYDELFRLSLLNPENKQYGWEKTNVLNAGVSFSLFSRFSADVEFYTKKSSDVLSYVSVDPTSGWSTLMLNAADISNTGLDVNMNALVLNTDVKWNLGVNFSTNKNEVTNVNYVPTLMDMKFDRPVAGQPVNAAWAINYGGLDNLGNPMIKKEGSNDVLSYTELSSFEDEDYAYLGSFDPTIFGSISSNLAYKDLSLNILFTYKFGHKIRMPNVLNDSFDSNIHEWEGLDNRWTKEGDEDDKAVPGLIADNLNTTAREDAYNYSTEQLDKGDIIRLKSVRLSYNINKVLKPLKLRAATLSFSAENLWYWAANKQGLDSDYLSRGYEGGVYNYPIAKKFVTSLNITF